MEFYRTERIQKLLIIRKLFQTYGKLVYGTQFRNNVKFPEFKEILEEISPGTTYLVIFIVNKQIIIIKILNYQKGKGLIV